MTRQFSFYFFHFQEHGQKRKEITSDVRSYAHHWVFDGDKTDSQYEIGSRLYKHFRARKSGIRQRKNESKIDQKSKKYGPGCRKKIMATKEVRLYYKEKKNVSRVSVIAYYYN